MAWSSAPVSMVSTHNQSRVMTWQADVDAGYDAGIMTVILADDQFNDYYNMTPSRQGVVATIPWATTGVAQLFVGGTLAALVGRLWALRLSIVFMCLGM
nr:hypothetical protein CFP56_68686 [Quercus suber]